MKQRKSSLLIMILILSFSFGQSQTNKSTIQVEELQSKLELSINSTESLISINDSLANQNRLLRIGIDSLSITTQEAVEKLEDNELFFDRINLYFTIIAVILGMFTILSPIIILTTGILPARNEIKNLKKTVHEFIVNRDRESINYAIEQLFSDSEKERYEASFILSNRIDFKFSNEDVKKIIEAHNCIKESQTKFMIRNILCNQVTLLADKFFRNEVKSKNLNLNMYHILRYISVSNSDFTSEFMLALKESDFPSQLYSQLITYSMNTSFALSVDFSNNQALIDIVVEKTELNVLKSIVEGIQNSAKVYNPDGLVELTNSKLVQRIIELEAIAKLQEDEKNESIETVSKKTKSESEIISEHGIKIIADKIVDSKGRELEPTQIVYTMIGPQRIKTGC